ncbi:TPA: SDR family oxidoreductase [Candidatus Poribacteria bacterium]|nr:SDR family oxidoreductase [Candidatus Poribacteria bacterium]HEX29419.1 SDR family oxidoreductase [Candidatus Poribacteria bacterium]
MKRVLITGGAGFIGSHLCELFLKKGYEVICVDNLISGNMDNIAHLFGERFTFLRYDITNPIWIPGRMDYILNFASPASPVDYMNHPIETLRVGAMGTYNMLELAREKGARFLHASTSEVYGDPLIHPQPETYWGNVNPIGPRSVYDEAKRYAEALVMAYHRMYGLDTRIVRIFNTYGPLMRPNDGRAIPNFISQALKNEPITVYGDGSQTRSFTYITDEIDGIYRLLMSDYHEPVNIGNPEEKTILELAKLIIEMTGSDSRIVFKPLPKDDPKVRRPDISRAKEVLSWEPKVPLEEGLKETIRYFRRLLQEGKI